MLDRWKLWPPLFALAVIGLMDGPEFGCAVRQSPANDIVAFPGTEGQARAGYTLETPIEVIAADPKGKAILNKDIPGLLANPRYEMFKGMTLRSLASLSGGRLSEETLAQTKADLADLPKAASARQ